MAMATTIRLMATAMGPTGVTVTTLFLCLRNIRTFLTACAEKFGLPKHRLFGAFDLFDVQDFGKVIDTLSTLSWTPIAQSKGFTPFPTEDCVGDDDIYSGLSDLIDPSWSLCMLSFASTMWWGPPGTPPFGRPKIDGELKVSSTERRSKVDRWDGARGHHENMGTPWGHQDSTGTQWGHRKIGTLTGTPWGRPCPQSRAQKGSHSRAGWGHPGARGALGGPGATPVPVPRYGFLLDKALIICKRRGDSYEAKEVVDLQSHQLRDGGLGPRDGKKVPQDTGVPKKTGGRVLGGPKIWDPTGCPCLVGPSIQVLGGPKSPRNLGVLPSAQGLGGPKHPALVAPKCPGLVALGTDGLPPCPQWTHTFLLIDTAGLQGYELFFKTRELKKKWLEQFEMALSNIFPEHALADGHDFQMFSFEDTTSCKACQMLLRWATRIASPHPPTGWETGRVGVSEEGGGPGEAFGGGEVFMGQGQGPDGSRIGSPQGRGGPRTGPSPGGGTFYQGYRCSRCRAPAHKECLGRLGTCGRAGADSSSGTRKNKSQRPGPEKKRGDLGESDPGGALDVWVLVSGGRGGVPVPSPKSPRAVVPSGLPKMEATQHYGGVPPPPGAVGPALRLSPGDIVEVTVAEAEQLWWQGRNVVNGDVGWFPCAAVRPFICTPLPDLSVYLWYAGPMERGEAEQILTPRSDGAFLVRQRVKDAGEFAISIKYRTEVKHIKVMTAEGLYRLTEKKAFKGLVELVEFYQRNSLKDCFKALDTALLVPFKEPESRAGPRPPGAVRSFGSAKARYDFCARDRTELTLREGDVIRVLSKKGHPGWWKGEIYGRVGWFPANYVEEDYSEYC
ncbi:proto-oncogene vav [Aix galericulata]|nr:proto-oncogene vav [Aix galericulata]